MNMTLRILFAACLWFVQPSPTQAEDISEQASNSPCSFKQVRGYYSKHSIVSFIEDPKAGRDRWICYGDKVLLASRPNKSGGYYDWRTEDGENDILNIREAAKYVDEKKLRATGGLVALRMIVKEETAGDGDNRYWLLDFRGEEPIVAGPMPIDEKDWSRYYTVIWNDQSMVLIFDDDGTPFGNTRPPWTKTAYRYIDQALRQEGAEQILSVILKNQMEPKVKKNEDPQAFAAYIYDYKGKRIIKSVIFNEKYYK